jgi:arsenate reductase (glutaredoxin)
MLRIYTLATCDTCRAATKWLRSRGVEFEEIAIRETPPKPNELRAALAKYEGDLRRLFNVAGRDYREQKIGEKLPEMTAPAALALLAGNGNLVKRPFLVGDNLALVGFNEKTWAAAIAARQTGT